MHCGILINMLYSGVRAGIDVEHVLRGSQEHVWMTIWLSRFGEFPKVFNKNSKNDREGVGLSQKSELIRANHHHVDKFYQFRMICVSFFPL